MEVVQELKGPAGADISGTVLSAAWARAGLLFFLSSGFNPWNAWTKRAATVWGRSNFDVRDDRCCLSGSSLCAAYPLLWAHL